MNDASADLASPPMASEVSWAPPDRRRTLQLVLAALWLLDAVLQLQPFMFTRGFGLLMLGPTARGNPGAIAHTIADVSRSIGQHSVGANTAFVVVQFLIAFGIAYRPTVRVALAVSALWALLVWWFGEGLGGVLAGRASPLTGAPGAVLLYGVIAILLWPRGGGETGGPFTAAGLVGVNAAKAIWIAIWGSLGAVALLGSPTRHPANLISEMTAGEPGWLAALNRHTAGLVAGRGALVAALVGAVFLGIAFGLVLPGPASRAVIAAAVLVAVVVWVLGEDLGAVFSGSATDPNTGPVLLLLAAAYWPWRGATPASPDPVPAG
jgi:hypothetical protein